MAGEATSLGDIVVVFKGDVAPLENVLVRIQSITNAWAASFVTGFGRVFAQLDSETNKLVTSLESTAGKVDATAAHMTEALQASAPNIGAALDPALERSAQSVESWGQRVGQSIRNTLEVAAGVLLAGAIDKAGEAIRTSLIDTNASLETTTLQFTTLMGDADQAAAHVKDLFDFAKSTPFETGPVIEASRNLRTLGGAALDTVQNLTMVGDAAAATGNNVNEVAEWTARAYNAIQSGRPWGEAAQRLMEMGVLSGDARNRLEDMSKSGASGTQVWAAFTQEMGQFNGAMEAQANSWTGLTSTLSDLINLNLATVFAPLFEALKGGVATINEALQSAQVQAFFDSAKEAVAGFVADVTAAAQQIAIWWGQVGPAIENALLVLQGLQQIVADSLADIGVPFDDLIADAVSWGEGLVEAFADGIASGLGYVTDSLGQIANEVSYWLTPGSPPPLLPDLDVWGAGAAEAYMGGWRDADFSALSQFGQDVSGVLENLVSAGQLGKGQDSAILAAVRTQFVGIINEAKETGSVSAASMAKLTEAAGPAGSAVAQLADEHVKLALATQRAADAQQALNDIQNELRVAQADLAAAQASGNAGLAAEARNRIALLKQRKADATQKQTDAQREQTLIQQQLKLQEQLIKAQQDQFAVLKKLTDSKDKKTGSKKKDKAEEEAKKAAEAQWQYNYSLADTDGKLRMLREKQAQYTQSQAEYWSVQSQIKSLEDARAKKAEQDAKALADAQFRHAMATADTAGKVELLKKKLSGLQEGTVEYENTLSELQQTEERLEKEREKAAKKKKGKGGGGAGEPGKDKKSAGAKGGTYETRGSDQRDAMASARAAAEQQRGAAERFLGELRERVNRSIAGLIDPSTPGKLIRAVGDVVAYAVGAVLQATPQVIAAFSGWSFGVLNWLAAAWPGMIQALGETAVVLIGEIGMYAPQIIAGFQAWSIGFLSWLTEHGPDMLAELGTQVGNILVAIGQALPGIVGAFARWGAALVDWLITDGPRLLRELGALVDQRLLPWIAQQVPGIATQLATWAGQFISWVADAGPRLILALGTLFGDLLIWIVNQNPGLSESLTNWITAFVTWPTKIWELLGVALDAVVKQIETWLNQAGRTLGANTDIGTGFIAGIKKGIEDGWEALKEWLMSKVRALIKVGKDAIDSHSPSRAAADEIGLPFMQGIGVGLEDGYPDVAATAARQAAGLTAAARGAMEQVTSPGATVGPYAFAGAAGGAGGLGGLAGTVVQGDLHMSVELPNVTSLEDPTIVEQIIYKVADRLKRGSR